MFRANGYVGLFCSIYIHNMSNYVYHKGTYVIYNFISKIKFC